MKPVRFLNLSPSKLDLEQYLNITKSVMEKGRFILGDQVESFEQEFAAYIGVKHCVAVGNGFDALRIIMEFVEVEEFDGVLVPANAPLPVWMAVSSLRADPMPIDPDIATYQIKSTKYRSGFPIIKAAIVVHMYGMPAKIDDLLSTEFPVIEDCCQAHGAEYAGRRVGSFGLASAFSFYPTKNLGCFGDGGAICTNSDEVAEFCRNARNYGNGVSRGTNSRLDEIQAAFLRYKLPLLNFENDLRRLKAKMYFDHLKDVPGIVLPTVIDNARPVWHQFVVYCFKRDNLKQYLADNNIETMIHYSAPCFDLPVYSPIYPKDAYPVSVNLSANILSLPIGTMVTIPDVEYVCEKIREFYAS